MVSILPVVIVLQSLANLRGLSKLVFPKQRAFVIILVCKIRVLLVF